MPLQLNTTQATRLNRVLSHIEQNLHQTVLVADLAELAGWSRWQLQRVFAEKTGLSVAQYIRHLRLSQAATQLISTSERHLDIALNAGFESEATFSRAFRQQFDCTPRQYRNRAVPAGIRFPLAETRMHSIRLEFRDAFQIHGLRCRTHGLFSLTPDYKQRIPELWKQTLSALSETQSEFSKPIGVIEVGEQSEGQLTYWVGCESFDPAPTESFQMLSVPASLYAVIRHIGPLDHLPETIRWFIVHWLDYSPYEAYEGFDIEDYLDLQESSEPPRRVDYWIPIRISQAPAPDRSNT